MNNSRSDRWKNPKQVLTLITGNNSEKIQKVASLQEELRGDNLAESQTFDVGNMISACRELIYKRESGHASFEAIMYMINAERLELEILYGLEITFKEDNNVNDEIQTILAIATIEEVPVYPNTPDLAQELADHHKRMLIHGFMAPDGQGGKVRLKITKKASVPTLKFAAFGAYTATVRSGRFSRWFGGERECRVVVRLRWF